MYTQILNITNNLRTLIIYGNTVLRYENIVAIILMRFLVVKDASE